MMQPANINQSKNVVVAVVQSLSCVRLSVTPWTAVLQTFLSFTISQSLLKFMPIESVMPSIYLILCLPLLLFLQSFPAPESFPMSQLFTSGGQRILSGINKGIS